jgi:uncharacterized lipoprotein YbaY
VSIGGSFGFDELLGDSGAEAGSGGAQSPDSGARRIVFGTVAYLERIALPPGGELTVRLIDTAKADAAAPVLAESVETVEGQVPFGFSLAFDPAAAEGAKLSLWARLVTDVGTWQTDADIGVDAESLGEPIDVIVRNTGSAS